MRPNESAQISKEAIKWKFQAPEFRGTYVSAAVANDLLFIGAEGGVLFALDRETGQELWHSTLDNGRVFYAAPVVFGVTVYVAEETQVTLFAASRVKRCLGRYDLGVSTSVHTPVIRDRIMYVSAGRSLWALRLPANL